MGYDNDSFIFQPFLTPAWWASSGVCEFEIGIPIKPAFSWYCRMYPVCALISRFQALKAYQVTVSEIKTPENVWLS